jgi:diguanylate cyclase (GGDEF)-like protein
MQQRIRSNDLLARFGGEEFAAILCDTDRSGALYLAEQLRDDLASHPCLYQGLSITLNLSIGVCALIPDAQSNRKQLLSQADQALYQAKAAGRNRVACYENSIRNDA